MADQTDVLIQQWQSRWEQIRHSETQRSVMSNMILVLSAAGLGFIAQKGLQKGVLVVSGSLMLLGIYGMAASAKYYERFRLHLREAREIRKRIDETYPEIGIEELIAAAWREHSREFPRLAKVPLYGAWILLHGGIVVVGGLLSLIIILRA